MDNVVALFEIDYVKLAVSIVIILVAVKFIVELLEWVFKKFGIEFKRKRDKELLEASIKQYGEISQRLEEKVDMVSNNLIKVSGEVNDMNSKLVTLETKFSSNEVATKEMLSDRIQQKLRHFMEIGYIPQDELECLNALYFAYRGMGGNHTTKQMYDYCTSNLPIKAVKVKYTEE